MAILDHNGPLAFFIITGAPTNFVLYSLFVIIFVEALESGDNPCFEMISGTDVDYNLNHLINDWLNPFYGVSFPVAF